MAVAARPRTVTRLPDQAVLPARIACPPLLRQAVLVKELVVLCLGLLQQALGRPETIEIQSSKAWAQGRITACHSVSPDARNCEENNFDAMNLEFNQVFSNLRFVCTLGSLSHAIEQSFCTLRGYCERTPSQKLMRQVCSE
ncbi:hypothetical protein CBM2633_A110063 [Cupriavidus taiwanensis]|nr:hypothetical protein CBM2633_A110063 [Cupriavidus taiwanensis]